MVFPCAGQSGMGVFKTKFTNPKKMNQGPGSELFETTIMTAKDVIVMVKASKIVDPTEPFKTNLVIYTRILNPKIG